VSSSPSPLVSVVLVADGPWEETLRALTALAHAAAGVAHEVIAVDDGTADETALALPRLPGLTALRGDVAQGFAAAANAGASQARAPLLAFLHGDAEPHPGWLGALVRAAADHPEAVAFGGLVVGPGGLLEGSGEPAVPAPALLPVEALPAVGLLVRAGRFAAAGGFGTGLPLGAEGADLCRRLRAAGDVLLLTRECGLLHRGRCRTAG
jgi:GT2 family glycosyltransferase